MDCGDAGDEVAEGILLETVFEREHERAAVTRPSRLGIWLEMKVLVVVVEVVVEVIVVLILEIVVAVVEVVVVVAVIEGETDIAEGRSELTRDPLEAVDAKESEN